MKVETTELELWTIS